MADKVRVKLNLRGINQVMTSQGATDQVVARAQRIARAAGEHFELVVKAHPHTARAYVQAKDAIGARQEARDKRLTRSIDAGR